MTSGMNVGEVRQLAQQLATATEQLRQLVSSIDNRVHASSWLGRDADTFKHQWWPQHRQAVLTVAEAVEGLGRSASNNADDQERASSAGGAGAAAQTSVGGSTSWLGAAGGALATGGVLTGQLVSGLQDQFEWFEHAKGFADMTDWKFFDDANAPVKGFLGDILKDGRITAIGHTMDVISVGSDVYKTSTDFQNGDYLGGGLDAADGIGNAIKGHGGPLGYLGGVAINEWADVGRAARQVDWNLTDPTYTQYMNPFVAKNWSETILPGAWSGVKQGVGETLENLLP